MKNNKEIKLYNVIFPVWLLFLFPLTWLVVIPANYVIDSLVLFVGMLFLGIINKMEIYKRSILWVFLFGFLADLIGGGLLFLSQVFGENDFIYEYFTEPLATNPFDNIYALIYTLLAVVISGVLIYVFNRFISFRKCTDKRVRRVLSLFLAVLTAPYLFLLPTTSLYGSGSESFTNHIVWTVYDRAEFYTSEDKDTDLLEGAYHETISCLKDGINTADKADETDLGDWDYRIKYYKTGLNGRSMDDIYLYVGDDGCLYFEWKDRQYKFDEDDSAQSLEYIEKLLSFEPNDAEVENVEE